MKWDELMKDLLKEKNKLQQKVGEGEVDHTNDGRTKFRVEPWSRNSLTN
jgi:hypothetical protein